MRKVVLEDYRVAVNQYWGWCTTCEDFSGTAEPDAVDYECPECGEKTLMGAEEALMDGEIAIG